MQIPYSTKNILKILPGELALGLWVISLAFLTLDLVGLFENVHYLIEYYGKPLFVIGSIICSLVLILLVFVFILGNKIKINSKIKYTIIACIPFLLSLTRLLFGIPIESYWWPTWIPLILLFITSVSLFLAINQISKKTKNL